MTPTPVGMRCPECARDRTKVKTLRSAPTTPVVTRALIVINVLAFIAETIGGSGLGHSSGQIYEKGALLGPLIAHQHEYWRLVTSGFLHDGIAHVFVNMLSLWFVGQVLEPAVGRLKFAVIYGVSLLAGSFGALLFQPTVPTIGASGAIFGIFGALIVVARARGIPLWQSGLAPILVLNLLFSISFRGISIGGHLGGLAAGLITGAMLVELGERRRQGSLALVGCGVVGVVSIVAAIAVAGSHGLTPNGLGIGA